MGLCSGESLGLTESNRQVLVEGPIFFFCSHSLFFFKKDLSIVVYNIVIHNFKGYTYL